MLREFLVTQKSFAIYLQNFLGVATIDVSRQEILEQMINKIPQRQGLNIVI
jgi:hypothetical protein